MLIKVRLRKFFVLNCENWGIIYEIIFVLSEVKSKIVSDNYMLSTLIWLKGAHTTHTGFGRLSRLSGIVVHVLVNWAFIVTT